MRSLWIAGARFRPSDATLVGQGGEAEVHRLDPQQVVKVWKGPDHPDFHGVADREAVRQRLRIYRQKVQSYPSGLPAAVVVPRVPARDRPRGGTVRGFTMEHVRDAEVLARFADPRFRRTVDPARVVARLLDLEAAVRGVHGAGVIIGDFNDLNVLVTRDGVRLIDADSFSVPGHPCVAYTVRTVDPQLCDPSALAPVLCRPYTPASDWYAFTVLTLRSLLMVDPYGGVYRPADPDLRCGPEARILRRVTVFHPEVRYPKPALPPEALPEPLLHHLQSVFTQEARGPFPRRLLEGLTFVTCPRCGRLHARRRCPVCVPPVATPAPGLRPPAPRVARGFCAVKVLARTPGPVLAAGWLGRRLGWLSHHDGRFVREDGRVVLEGDPDPALRFAVRGAQTVVAGRGRLVRLHPGAPPDTVAVDPGTHGPAFATHGDHLVWADGDRLFSDGPTPQRSFGPLELGRVLARHGRFWVGPTFGLGFYRARGLSVYFTFCPDRRGLQDRVALSPLRGAVLAAHAALSASVGWLFTATVEAGRRRLTGAAVAPDGRVLGTREADAELGGGAARWMANAAGACAAGDALFVPSDEGILRVEVLGNELRRTRTFVDTEPFVDRASVLLPAPEGLAVISRREIRQVTVA